MAYKHLITNNLYNKIIVEPYKRLDVNRLLIVTGYASYAMSRLTYNMLNRNNDLNINIVVGMANKDGINQADHEGYNKLQDESGGKFSFSYRAQENFPVHSKVYIWCKNKKPICAFSGSANYTQTALISGRQHELMNLCDGKEASRYFNDIFADSISCTNPASGDFVKIFHKPVIASGFGKSVKFKGLDVSHLQHAKVPLTAKNGKIGNRSGLNWGHRDVRNRDEAYIPLKKDIRTSDFFPQRAIHFIIYTDDGFFFHCTRAQEGDKAIETYQNNSILGLYFRKRLGLESGAFVTLDDLSRYGRTDVDFYKLNDEAYYMDFSKPR